MTRRMRFTVVSEPEEVSELDELEELDELDEPERSMIFASSPGCDSSSIRCCGVLTYMCACDLS